jgi:hypothetical protein
MQALTLDEKIIALTDLISINTDPRRIADLEDQRAHLLILRYPAYRDHNVGNKPVLKARPEYAWLDIDKLIAAALNSGKVFALIESKGSTHVFFIHEEQAVIIKVMSNSRGDYYNASQETREDARERYSQLLDQGCKKVAEVSEIAAKVAKEYLK